MPPITTTKAAEPTLRDIPPELRNRIYELVLDDILPLDPVPSNYYSRHIMVQIENESGISPDEYDGALTFVVPPIAHACSQTRRESLPMFFNHARICIYVCRHVRIMKGVRDSALDFTFIDPKMLKHMRELKLDLTFLYHYHTTNSREMENYDFSIIFGDFGKKEYRVQVGDYMQMIAERFSFENPESEVIKVVGEWFNELDFESQIDPSIAFTSLLEILCA